MSAQPAYETDVVAWSREQARLLRAGKFDQLDIEHIADEVEDVGKSEERELANRMAVLLAHLLKWQFQPALRGSSWQATIRNQRTRITRRLAKTPSLKPVLAEAEWLDDMWGDARQIAEKETGIPFDKFPASLSWPMDRVLSLDFFPEV